MKEALHGELLPRLFDTALHPVQFSGFPVRSTLEYLTVALEERSVEVLCGAMAVPTGSGRRGVGGTSTGATAMSVLDDLTMPSVISPPTRLDPDAARWGKAKRLQVCWLAECACLMCTCVRALVCLRSVPALHSIRVRQYLCGR